jgi:hypothetical protein
LTELKRFENGSYDFSLFSHVLADAQPVHSPSQPVLVLNFFTSVFIKNRTARQMMMTTIKVCIVFLPTVPALSTQHWCS